jgi:hypothetical protein
MPHGRVIPLNDGVEVFALLPRLIRALADATSTELEELADRWTARLRSADGDEMTRSVSAAPPEMNQIPGAWGAAQLVLEANDGRRDHSRRPSSSRSC